MRTEERGWLGFIVLTRGGALVSSFCEKKRRTICKFEREGRPGIRLLEKKQTLIQNDVVLILIFFF